MKPDVAGVVASRFFSRSIKYIFAISLLIFLVLQGIAYFEWRDSGNADVFRFATIITPLLFGMMLLVSVVFSVIAAVVSSVWFNQRETPVEFAIQPHRLKAVVWGVFCLLLPLLIVLVSLLFNSTLDQAQRYAQFTFLIGVGASFVANGVMNGMADEVRSDPYAKAKRLQKTDHTIDTPASDNLADEYDVVLALEDETDSQDSAINSR